MTSWGIAVVRSWAYPNKYQTIKAGISIEITKFMYPILLLAIGLVNRSIPEIKANTNDKRPQPKIVNATIALPIPD